MDLLPRSFYEADTVEVARTLIGKVFVRTTDAGIMSGRIVETEAYKQGDPACHAFRGKTERNAVMFGPAGFTYVYFSYGMHYMLNVVTRELGCGEAVLIRAIEPIEGIELMRANAGVFDDYPASKLLNGPGKLAKSLAITRDICNNIDLATADSALTIWAAGGEVIADDPIGVSTRIGITQGVDLPWRFVLTGSPALSRR